MRKRRLSTLSRANAWPSAPHSNLIDCGNSRGAPYQRVRPPALLLRIARWLPNAETPLEATGPGGVSHGPLYFPRRDVGSLTTFLSLACAMAAIASDFY